MKPKIIQIEDSEQAIKSIVGGEVDRIKIPSDDVTILFQKDGVVNGKTLNRVAEINEEKETEMSYSELTSMFRKQNMRVNILEDISPLRRIVLIKFILWSQELMASAVTTTPSVQVWEVTQFTAHHWIKPI